MKWGKPPLVLSSPRFLKKGGRRKAGEEEDTLVLEHREWENTVLLGQATEGKLWLVRVCSNLCNSYFSGKHQRGWIEEVRKWPPI